MYRFVEPQNGFFQRQAVYGWYDDEVRLAPPPHPPHTHTHAHVLAHSHTRTHAHSHTHIHTHAHTHSHAYTHTCTQVRFDFFSKAALEFLLRTGRQPDIPHCHDWSTANVAKVRHCQRCTSLFVCVFVCACVCVCACVRVYV